MIGASERGDGMGLQLACCDASFPMLSHKASLMVIVDLGFPAVDLCLWSGHAKHITPEAVAANPRETAEETLRNLRETPLAISDVFPILHSSDWSILAVNHPNREERNEARRCFQRILEYSIRVGSPGITVLPGVPWPGEDSETSLARSAEELQWRAEMAEREGLQLSVEPHYQSILPTPRMASLLLEQVPNLMITLDYSHFVYQRIPEVEGDILIPRTRHVQARQAAPGLVQATSKDGVIDFPRIIRLLEETGRDIYFSTEYCWDEWMNTNRVDCISETALLADIFLRATKLD